MPSFCSNTVIDVNPGYRLSILKLNKCYVYISNLFTLLWNFALVVFIIATNFLTCVTEKSLYSIIQMHSFYCDCLKIGLFVSKSPLSIWCTMCWKWCHYEALKENIDICWRLFDKICNRGWFLSTKFHVYEKQAIRNYYTGWFFLLVRPRND